MLATARSKFCVRRQYLVNTELVLGAPLGHSSPLDAVTIPSKAAQPWLVTPVHVRLLRHLITWYLGTFKLEHV
jgi:hypothetical protein